MSLRSGPYSALGHVQISRPGNGIKRDRLASHTALLCATDERKMFEAAPGLDMIRPLLLSDDPGAQSDGFALLRLSFAPVALAIGCEHVNGAAGFETGFGQDRREVDQKRLGEA